MRCERKLGKRRRSAATAIHASCSGFKLAIPLVRGPTASSLSLNASWPKGKGRCVYARVVAFGACALVTGARVLYPLARESSSLADRSFLAYTHRARVTPCSSTPAAACRRRRTPQRVRAGIRRPKGRRLARRRRWAQWRGHRPRQPRPSRR